MSDRRVFVFWEGENGNRCGLRTYMAMLRVFKGDRPRLNAEVEERFSAFSPFEVVVWQENGAVPAVATSRFKPRTIPPVLRCG